MRTQHTVTIHEELELDVTVNKYSAHRGARELGSGVQLEPDEPASVEFDYVELVYKGRDGQKKKMVIDLPPEILEDLEIRAAEEVNAEPDGGY